jgi:predicted HicB family RNase H-like nuclease
MSQNLGEYRGYSGSVLYSAEDRVLHGRIVGIRDAITFEGENVRQLETNFKLAVDEYLQFCKERGKVVPQPDQVRT